ncbi:hypothetical protein AN641_02805 [Candidatus Epulonipiscioides gigas]|nr:hypothetical protein AN641_02805 [Epulopiscium sp. SCG-C07WGA-EpuloA2]
MIIKKCILIISSKMVLAQERYIISMINSVMLGVICFSKNPIMNIASKTSINTTTVNNYFIKYMLSDKIYFINIIVVVGVGIFCALELPHELNMPLGCFMIAANSPLLTIFSIEKI